MTAFHARTGHVISVGPWLDGVHLTCILCVQNTLRLYEVHIDASSGDGSLKALPFEKTDVWALSWAADDPSMFAIMEKHRLIIVQDQHAEEPYPTGSYLVKFGHLEADLVDLTKMMLAADVRSALC
jgi:hypothetical protein